MTASKILNINFFLMCIFVFVFNYNATTFIGVSAYTWTNIIVIAFIAISLINVFKSRNGKLRWSNFYTCFLLFVGACFVSVLYSYAVDASLSRTLRMFELLVLSVTIYQQIDTKEKLDIYLKLFAWAGSISALYLLVFSDRTQRIGDIVGDANQIGITLSFAATIAIYLLKNEKKIIYVPMIAILLIAILFTGSRAALVLIVLAIVANVYISAFQKHWNFLKIIGMTIVLIGILIGGFYLVMNIELLYRTNSCFILLPNISRNGIRIS